MAQAPGICRRHHHEKQQKACLVGRALHGHCVAGRDLSRECLFFKTGIIGAIYVSHERVSDSGRAAKTKDITNAKIGQSSESTE